jgi:hypothetical protein
MSMEEVESVMGEPDGVLRNEERVEWSYERRERVRLLFHDGELLGTDVKGHPVNAAAARSHRAS